MLFGIQSCLLPIVSGRWLLHPDCSDRLFQLPSGHVAQTLPSGQLGRTAASPGLCPSITRQASGTAMVRRGKERARDEEQRGKSVSEGEEMATGRLRKLSGKEEAAKRRYTIEIAKLKRVAKEKIRQTSVDNKTEVEREREI